MEKVAKRKEKICEHRWFLDGTPNRPTGKYAFMGRTLICTKCKLKLHEKVANTQGKFRTEMKKLDLS